MSKKKCAICDSQIVEYFGKLEGTMLKVINLDGKRGYVHVCPDCQKIDRWIEKAKVRGA